MPFLAFLHDGCVSYEEALKRRGRKFTGFTHVEDLDIEVPTTLVVGSHPGNTVLITSGIHGAEYCGIEAVARLAHEMEPEEIHGSLIILHCCNQAAFYDHHVGIVPEDGLNLNRAFPTSDKSTHTHAIAHFLQDTAVTFADFHVDIHSGDANEALTPHCYYSANTDLGETAAASRDMALHAGMPFAVASYADHCVYQNSNFHHVPSILMEMGQQGRWGEREAKLYAQRLKMLLGYLGVLEAAPAPTENTRDVKKALYTDAEESGLWYPQVAPGDTLHEGDHLGSIRDFFGRTLSKSYAQADGVVLYMTSSLSVRKDGPLIAYACLSA